MAEFQGAGFRKEELSDDEEKVDLDDWEEDDEAIQVKSLFCGNISTSLESMVEYDKQTFGFDLRETVLRLGIDEMAMIMLVNYIRKTVADAGAAPLDAAFFATLNEEINNTKAFMNTELYMKPVLEEDPLLFMLPEFVGLADYEDEEEEVDRDPVLRAERKEAAKREAIEKNPQLAATLESLQNTES
jgi:hypothetical protein